MSHMSHGDMGQVEVTLWVVDSVSPPAQVSGEDEGLSTLGGSQSGGRGGLGSCCRQAWDHPTSACD